MRKVAAFCHVIDAISERVGKGISYLVILMVLLLVYEVIMRYAFNSPTVFAHEASLFLYGTTGMLAGAWVLRHEGHVRMDAIYGRLSPRTRAIIDLATAPLFFLLVGVVLWTGWDMAYFSVKVNEHTQTPWGPPYYPLKLAIPLAALLILLQGIVKFIRDFFLFCRKELP
ncbi:hypothetical protein ES707_04303 [subsurface metagenome]